jgi:hypothetical protein
MPVSVLSTSVVRARTGAIVERGYEPVFHGWQWPVRPDAG